MRGKGEDLPIAGTETVEDLEPDFTYDELLNELAGYFPEPRQPGDIDAWQLAEKHGVTHEHASKVMNKIARADPGWITVKVMDGKRPSIKVLRRLSQNGIGLSKNTIT